MLLIKVGINLKSFHSGVMMGKSIRSGETSEQNIRKNGRGIHNAFSVSDSPKYGGRNTYYHQNNPKISQPEMVSNYYYYLWFPNLGYILQDDL